MKADTANEKPGKPSWKDRLQAAESMPGIAVPDMDLAWQKLHSRLQEKKPRRLAPAFYWVAAASLIAIGIVVFVNPKDLPVHNTSKSAIQTNSTAPAPVHAKPFLKHNTIAMPEDNVAVATKAKHSSQPTDKQIPPASTVLQTNAAAKPVETQPALPLPQPIEIPDAQPVMVLVSAPAKTKLKVVHINELGEPVFYKKTSEGNDVGFIRFRPTNSQVQPDSKSSPGSIGLYVFPSHTTLTN